MTRDEELAVLSTVEKAIKDRLSDLKAEYKHELMDMEKELGVDRMAVKVDGKKVGEVYITRAQESVELNPASPDAIFRLDDLGLVEMVPVKGWQDSFKVSAGVVIHRESSEVCEWLVPVQSYVKGTTVKIRYKDVVEMAPQLGSVSSVYGLLGGSSDE